MGLYLMISICINNDPLTTCSLTLEALIPLRENYLITVWLSLIEILKIKCTQSWKALSHNMTLGPTHHTALHHCHFKVGCDVWQMFSIISGYQNLWNLMNHERLQMLWTPLILWEGWCKRCMSIQYDASVETLSNVVVWWFDC